MNHELCDLHNFVHVRTSMSVAMTTPYLLHECKVHVCVLSSICVAVTTYIYTFYEGVQLPM